MRWDKDMTNHLNSTVEKWRALVDRLIFYTGTKKVAWKSSADEGTYVSKVSGTQISITEAENSMHWESPDYIIKIYNKSGDVIDTFTDEDISETENPYYKKMRNLYNTIVRINNGSEEVLDDLLEKLPDPDELPF